MIVAFKKLKKVGEYPTILDACRQLPGLTVAHNGNISSMLNGSSKHRTVKGYRFVRVEEDESPLEQLAVNFIDKIVGDHMDELTYDQKLKILTWIKDA